MSSRASASDPSLTCGDRWIGFEDEPKMNKLFRYRLGMVRTFDNLVELASIQLDAKAWGQKSISNTLTDPPDIGNTS
jgi:hypothetical protein